MNVAQKIAELAMKVFQNLPLITSLAPAGVSFIQNAISIFRDLKDNPNATMADIDAAIAKIEANSAKIQSMK